MSVKAPAKSGLRPFSSIVLDGESRAPSRAMLYPVGFTEADFSKPQIGVASTWSMVTPCNMHIDQLAREAALGVDGAGGKATIFNTITISDGISMGTEGMKYSLVSREVIADSIETVVGCQGFDGFVAIGGCDKNMPGCCIAIARLNRPAVFVYGGTILPGCLNGRNLDIVSVFEAVGAEAAGRIDRREMHDVESCAIPGPGSCGGMYTANTMASALEAMGLSLPNSSAQAAISKHKVQDCRDAGAAVIQMLKKGIRPSDIFCREAFENAIAVVIALGGSTNAVLHLLAIAHAANVRLTIDDFTRVGKRVPVLADLRPSGRFLMSELVEIGGIVPMMKQLLHAGLLHGDCLTVTGKTLKQNLAPFKPYPKDQQIIALDWESPEEGQPSGHSARESGARGIGRENQRQGRPAIQRPGTRLRERGSGDARHSRRQNQEGRRHRDSLRRSAWGTWHARDALPNQRRDGSGFGQGCCAHYRRQILRRNSWLRCGTYHA